MNINELVRDNELTMSLNMGADATSMTLSFDFDVNDHTGSQGRTAAVDGDWSFNFSAQ